MVDALLVLARDTEAESPLTQCEYSDDASSEWAYDKALLRLSAGREPFGGRPTVLAEAFAWNEHVVAYFIGSKSLPEQLPARSEIGTEGRSDLVCR